MPRQMAYPQRSCDPRRVIGIVQEVDKNTDQCRKGAHCDFVPDVVENAHSKVMVNLTQEKYPEKSTSTLLNRNHLQQCTERAVDFSDMLARGITLRRSLRGLLVRVGCWDGFEKEA